MKLKKRTKSIVLLIGITIFSVIIFYIAINISIATTFNVSVTSEQLSFKTVDENNSRIPLRNVQAFNFDGDSLGVFNGTFHIAKDTDVLVKRISNSHLYVTIENKGKISAGSFYNDEQDDLVQKAGDFVEFVIENPSDKALKGENIIIPFSGDVILGNTVSYATFTDNPGLVRSGKITMIGKSLLNNDFFESGTYDLNVGDQFLVENAKSKAYGFVVVNENPAMEIAYRVVGEKGKIITPGSMGGNEGYFISTTFFSRFLYDSTFQVISWAFASVVFFATILAFLVSYEDLTVKKKKKK